MHVTACACPGGGIKALSNLGGNVKALRPQGTASACPNSGVDVGNALSPLTQRFPLLSPLSLHLLHFL